MTVMDLSHRQYEANDTVDRITHHLRDYPSDIRRVRKLMRLFHATAADVDQALNQLAAPLVLRIDPDDTGDKVLLHLLRYPGDMIDMRSVMRQLCASEKDVQQAFAKLATYIAEGGERSEER